MNGVFAATNSQSIWSAPYEGSPDPWENEGAQFGQSISMRISKKYPKPEVDLSNPLDIAMSVTIRHIRFGEGDCLIDADTGFCEYCGKPDKSPDVLFCAIACVMCKQTIAYQKSTAAPAAAVCAKCAKKCSQDEEHLE